MLPLTDLRFVQASESKDAASGKTLDSTNTNDVTQAGGSQECGMSHSTEESSVWKLGANVGVLDRGLANSNSNHVAQDHDQGDLGGPRDGGWSDREEVGQHSGR